MAKRVRGQRSTHRPGGIGPARPEREPSSVRRAIPSTPAPMAAGTALGMPGDAVVATRPTATAASSRTTGATRDLRARTRLRSGLEQKAAAEAGWVSEDLRRIAIISAIMVAGLLVAWVLLVVVGLGDFY